MHKTYAHAGVSPGAQPCTQSGASTLALPPSQAGSGEVDTLRPSEDRGQGAPASATAASSGAVRITFLYRLQEGAADASFGMCACLIFEWAVLFCAPPHPVLFLACLAEPSPSASPYKKGRVALFRLPSKALALLSCDSARSCVLNSVNEAF